MEAEGPATNLKTSDFSPSPFSVETEIHTARPAYTQQPFVEEKQLLLFYISIQEINGLHVKTIKTLSIIYYEKNLNTEKVECILQQTL